MKYSLSYRDVAQIMKERGLNISHTTIMRWGRAVDSKGSTIDSMLSENRDIQAAKRFFKKKLPNAMLGFKSFSTAEKTIMGIEAFHLLRKEQVEISPVLTDVEWIHKLLGLTA